ncbi:MAG: prephenate dehydratase, partial [Verrucomicrobiota bacterium]
EIKKKSDLEIYAPEREESLLQNLIAKNQGLLTETSIRAIYREIMSAALALEEDLKIAFLGPKGTWTHQAAINKFGNSVGYLPLSSLADVFNKVERREADYGVVPIENSTEGAVNHTLDLFADSPLRIFAQIILPLENHVLSKVPLEAVAKLYSHPHVFGQCRKWISENFAHGETVEVSSTAKAAALAQEDPSGAALGGALLAELFGLDILDRSVQDNAFAQTRFLVIGRRTCPPTGNDRTSIMFSVTDEPGALFHALKPFNQFQINLSKIESRPNRRESWEHYFYVDLAAHYTDDRFETALDELRSHCIFVKILGSYPDTKPNFA